LCEERLENSRSLIEEKPTGGGSIQGSEFKGRKIQKFREIPGQKSYFGGGKVLSDAITTSMERGSRKDAQVMGLGKRKFKLCWGMDKKGNQPGREQRTPEVLRPQRTQVPNSRAEYRSPKGGQGESNRKTQSGPRREKRDQSDQGENRSAELAVAKIRFCGQGGGQGDKEKEKHLAGGKKNNCWSDLQERKMGSPATTVRGQGGIGLSTHESGKDLTGENQ